MARPAAAHAADVQTAWRLLDYIAVDYGGAVRAGRCQRVRICRNARVLRFGPPAHRRRCRPTRRKRGSRRPAVCRRDRAQGRAAAKSRGSPERSGSAGLSGGAGARRPRPRPAVPSCYNQNCASCHGANGDAKTSTAREAQPSADRLRRPRPRRRPQPVRALPGDRPGARRHRDGRASRACPTQDSGRLPFTSAASPTPPSLAAKGRNLGKRRGGESADSRPRRAERARLKSLAQRLGADMAAAVIAYLRSDPAAVDAPRRRRRRSPSRATAQGEPGGVQTRRP